MTLEEKAKNYAWKYPVPYSLYEKIGDKKELLGDVLEQVYIAGATENAVVWHDLRKNPEDLPPRKGLETYSDRVITDKGYSVYNFRKCRWYVDDPDCDCMVHTEVVAWTEIPVFGEVDNA